MSILLVDVKQWRLCGRNFRSRMAKFDLNLVEDIDRLFREKTIEEIMEVERLLDAEIEHKRVELRSMVG